MPGDADAPEVVSALTGGLGAPVRLPGARALWTEADAGIVAWSPASVLLGDHWWFALGLGARARLDAAADAWVAARPRGGSVVYAPWSAVAAALPAAAAGRVHLRVTAARPALLGLPGGGAVEGVTDPARLAAAS